MIYHFPGIKKNHMKADKLNIYFQRNFWMPRLSKQSSSTLMRLSFAVGPKELNSLRLIEKHYHKDKLLRSFDFKFGFCIPNSVNTWESEYEVYYLLM